MLINIYGLNHWVCHKRNDCTEMVRSRRLNAVFSSSFYDVDQSSEMPLALITLPHFSRSAFA